MRKTTQKLLDYYQSVQQDIKQSSPDLINQYREAAIEKFKEVGIPTSKLEDYKYLNIEPLFDKDFRWGVENETLNINIDEVFKCDVITLNTHLVLMAKGQFVKKQVDDTESKDIIICSLKEAASKHQDIFKKYYHQQASSSEDGTVALNSALANDGVFVYVPKNKQLKKPLQIANLQIDGKQNNAVHLRHLIVMEENSEAKLMFCDDSFASNEHLSNTVTEIFVEENARLETVKKQNEHHKSYNINSTFVQQKAHSTHTITTVTLNGGVLRNNLKVDMLGEYCESNAFGLALIDQQQNVDTFVKMNHLYPNCNSNQLFKNIIDDEGKGAFAGKVLVAKEAQKTNALQSNNNIVLTSTAKMNTKPQLVIYADDVKCSHGATVGQLDQDAFFYMKARGIDEKEAKMLLLFAFASDVVNRIGITSLKDNTEMLFQKRLRGKSTICNACSSKILM